MPVNTALFTQYAETGKKRIKEVDIISKEITWTDAQRAAIEIQGRQILVSAAAGSGKSTVLTERIISSITDKSNPHDLQKLMVVTFTRASAEDLKEKISKAVRDAVTADPKNKRLAEQLVKLSSAQINTIHGVCFNIIKRHFDTLKLPASVAIADDIVINALKLSIMQQLINDCYDGTVRNTDGFDFFVDNFINDDDTSIADKLIDVYNKLKNEPDGFNFDYADSYEILDDKYQKTGFGEAVIKRLLIILEYYKTVFLKAVDYFYTEPGYASLIDSFNQAINYIDKLVYECIPQNDISLLYEALNDKPRASTAKTSTVTELGQYYREERKNFGKILKKLCDTTLNFFSEPNKPHLTAIKNATQTIHKVLFTLLKEFDRRFSEAKLKQSTIDFNDIEHYTLKLLYDDDGNVSSIAKEISCNLDEIYVDEYQDLNPLQNKIFRALSVSAPIFMVGDIKQSIYGFRGADPSAFSEYKKSFPEFDTSQMVNKSINYGNSTVFLSSNFRSDFTITEFANKVSDAMFSNSGNEIYSYRIPYSKADRLIFGKNSDMLSSEAVVLLNCEPNEKTEESDISSTYSLEAENVANEISKLISAGVKATDICILLRGAKTAAPIFEKALKARNIATNSEKGSKLFDMPEIQLAMCLLNCCDNPYRDIFLSGALRSPVFGITLNDLIKIKQYSSTSKSLYDSLIKYTEENSFKKGEYFLSFLSKMRSFALNSTVDRILWQIYVETSFFSVIYDGGKIDKPQATARRANLIKLHEIAKSYSQSSQNGLYGFIEKMRFLIDDKNAPNAAIPDGNAVSIMTIHSSKGLEFEYCFVCGTSHALECKEAKEKLIFKHGIGIGTTVKLFDQFTTFETPYHTAIKHLLQLSYVDEEMRMLYVALTRARKKLYISSQLPDFEIALNDARLCATTPHYYNFVRKLSYIHWILIALHTESDINPKYQICNLSENAVKQESLDIINNTDSVLQKRTERDVIDYTAFRNELKQILSFTYKNKNAVILPSKLSVSKLYPEILDQPIYFGISDLFDNNSADSTEENQNALKIPSFMLNDETVSGADIGTATHVFMQFCDFDRIIKNGIEAEIEYLTNKRFILPLHAKIIDKRAVIGFLDSDIFKQMKNAEKVNREYRFNIKLSASEFTANQVLKEELENEYIFVQGIIDCYFKDASGNITLVDYKTDYVPKEIKGDKIKENEYFIKKHSKQLNYYRIALKNLTGAKVIKTYVYSFSLSKAIEIP